MIVKGKEQPVTLYQVLSAGAAPAAIVECEDLEPLKLTEK